MAQLFLHLVECGEECIDEEGVEMVDLAAARNFAVGAARAVMADEVTNGRLCLSCHIRIADAHDETLMIPPFREALAVSGL